MSEQIEKLHKNPASVAVKQAPTEQGQPNKPKEAPLAKVKSKTDAPKKLAPGEAYAIPFGKIDSLFKRSNIQQPGGPSVSFDATQTDFGEMPHDVQAQIEILRNQEIVHAERVGRATQVTTRTGLKFTTFIPLDKIPFKPGI